MINTIKKSCAASLVLTLACVCSLSVENKILGSILFSFGLITICIEKMNLFTGKCGYVINDSQIRKNILLILIGNLIAGWCFGAIYGTFNPAVQVLAAQKIASWNNVSLSLVVIQSICCGIVMYLAVDCFKANDILGILYGIPLFILSGFQHSIANIIYCGLGLTIDMPYIIVCILGNWLGSLSINFFLTDFTSLSFV